MLLKTILLCVFHINLKKRNSISCVCADSDHVTSSITDSAFIHGDGCGTNHWICKCWLSRGDNLPLLVLCFSIGADVICYCTSPDQKYSHKSSLRLLLLFLNNIGSFQDLFWGIESRFNKMGILSSSLTQSSVDISLKYELQISFHFLIPLVNMDAARLSSWQDWSHINIFTLQSIL